MSRTGRPKADNPKLHRVDVRITADLDRRLTAYSKKVGKSKPRIMREATEAFLNKEENK